MSSPPPPPPPPPPPQPRTEEKREHPSPETLLLLQEQLHSLMRHRAAELIEKSAVELPVLSAPQEDDTQTTTESEEVWFPIPGMYGGFSYRLVLTGEGSPCLMVESWCRLCGGSGQRHRVTVKGFTLLDEGFV